MTVSEIIQDFFAAIYRLEHGIPDPPEPKPDEQPTLL
jgi:hypothetical protein